MTVGNTTNEAAPQQGTGSLTVFPFSFQVQNTSQVQVYTKNGDADPDLVSSGITVALNTGGNGGTVTFNTPPASTVQVIIRRNPNYLQSTSFPLNRNLDERALEIQLDKLTMQDQDLLQRLIRSIQLPYGTSSSFNGQISGSAIVGSVPKAVLDGSGNVIGIEWSTRDPDNLNITPAEINSAALVTAAGGTTARTLAQHFAFGWVNVLDYGAVGDGVTDDTAAIQAAITNSATGATIFFPSGKTFNCTDGLTIGAKKELRGSGLLSFSAGITTKAAIAINANGCKLIGLQLDNPNKLQATSGGRNYGIQAVASEITIELCTIEHFQNGIAVSSGGEYENIIIANNRIKDCIGAGGGRGSSSSAGEDRGDGIVVWGTQATVVGNIVNAEAGQDCRIGIHGEALDSFAGGPPPTGYYHSLMTFTGNIVYGQFRRGLVFEGIDNGAIIGNVVADSTWWSICLAVGCKNCVVSGNSIMATRTAADDQGSNWSVQRAALAVYGKCYDCVFSSNSIRFTPGATIPYGFNMQGVNSNKTITGVTNANPGVITCAAHGFINGQRILLQTASAGIVELNHKEILVANATTDTFEINDLAGNPIDTSAMSAYTSGGTLVVNVPTRIRVENNVFSNDGATVTDGIYCPYSYDCVFRNNSLLGPMNRGAYCFNPIRISFEGNRFYTTSGRGIHVEGSSRVRVLNNVFRDIGAAAVYIANGKYHDIRGNVIENCTYAFDLFGTTNSRIGDNMVSGATTGNVNAYGTTTGSTANIFHNNNWQRLRQNVTWNIGSLADGAREQYGSDVTVTGARLGDRVFVSANLDVQGIKLFGWVKSDDTVNIAAENETGSTIDLASANVTVIVERSL